MKDNYTDLIREEIELLSENSRFLETANFIQHGTTTVYEHSVKVAYLSCKLADKLEIDIDYKVLIRGALLHDYFLYDWHDKKAHEGWHGFRHPRKAWKNAKREFKLKKIEEDIILKHMFPLIPLIPMHRESWIVCIADKMSAVAETFGVLNKGFELNTF